MWRTITFLVMFPGMITAAYASAGASIPTYKPVIQPSLPQLERINEADQGKAYKNNNVYGQQFTQIKLCDRCHTGEIQNKFLPILQGQNLDYLFKKILSYKNNPKSLHPFPADIKNLSETDMLYISRYYAQQQSSFELKWVLPLFVQDGKTNALLKVLPDCQKCHGDDGKGYSSIPALSGQKVDYLSYRIREISANKSRVNVITDELVRCEIPPVDIRQSRQLAAMFGVVINQQSAYRGKIIYQHNCASCHDNGRDNAPELGQKKQWVARVTNGTEILIKNIISGNSRLTHDLFQALTYQQQSDAVHYMVDQIDTSISRAQ